MARPRRRSAPDLPPSVSRRALLEDGSDAQFRALIHDLIAYGHRLDACRDAFATILGVSGAQYEILMLVARAAGTQGLSVSEVAARLHRSGAFITIEAARLVERGMLEKHADPADGRRVLLHTTRKAERMLHELAPVQQQVNDALFECLDTRRFGQLRALASDLLACSDRAVELAAFLARTQGADAA